MADVPDDFLDFIGDFAERLGLKRSDPDSDDPEDYPRAVEISKDEFANAGDSSKAEKVWDLLLIIERRRDLRRRAHGLAGQMDALWHESEMLKAKLFSELETLWPDIAPGDPARGGTGYRTFRSKLYYVGWDRKEKSQKRKDDIGGG